jgi:hypothetical protein
MSSFLNSFSPYRAYHGMVYFNGLVYIIGGFDVINFINNQLDFIENILFNFL